MTKSIFDFMMKNWPRIFLIIFLILCLSYFVNELFHYVC